MRLRIKRIKKDVNTRIFDNYVELYGIIQGAKKYKYFQLTNDLLTLKSS